jgi:hypothetical protein
MATITVSPNPAKVGKPVVVSGSGFAASSTVDCIISQLGIDGQIKSDVNGDVSTTDLAVRATGTLTSDATIPTANDTVTVGTVTYTFVTTPGATANNVALGASAAAALANLKHAINADGTAGAYGTATVANPDVTAGVLTTTTLALYAKVAGTAGNSLATTETSTHLSFGATTLTGGAASDAVSPITITPQTDAPFDVTLTDGTNKASAHVTVFTE